MTRLGVLALAVLLVPPVGVRAERPADGPWVASQAKGVPTVAWSAEQVATFLETVTHSDDAIGVGEFRFVDLLGDGQLELVATVDYSGRRFSNHVVVVQRKGPAAFAVQEIEAYGAERLDGLIVDVDGDGRQELVLPEALTPYLGGPVPQVRWIAIYRRTGARYEEATRRFSAYYSARVLPPLRQALERARGSGDRQALAVAALELEKAMRFSGAEPEYGLTTARALASSAEPNLRIWAAFALADIGTPATTEALERLTEDSDPRVSAYATAARDQAARRARHGEGEPGRRPPRK